MKYEHECPLCGKIKFYETLRRKIIADKHGSKCTSCAAKTAKFNPFRDGMDLSYRKNENFRKSCSRKGAQNSFSKGLKQLFIEKYGQETAEKKWEERRKKLSNAFKGDKNPMYGISPKIGAGRGLSCKYKGIYFRSLLELSYFVQIIERFKLKFQSAEIKDLKIKYENEKGIRKTYSADFLIEEKYLVEIKPKSLHNTKTNILKKNAAEYFCAQRNLVYKMTHVSLLKKEILEKMYNDRILSFDDKRREIFLKWISKK